MSSNRLLYDTCSTKQRLNESVGPLAYVLNPMAYENCNKCRHELGLVGGSAVSHITGNLVDLESDLRNQTRPATLCPSLKWHPMTDQYIRTPPAVCHNSMVIDTTPKDLPSCQMIRYKPTPIAPKVNLDYCEKPKRMNMYGADGIPSVYP